MPTVLFPERRRPEPSAAAAQPESERAPAQPEPEPEPTGGHVQPVADAVSTAVRPASEAVGTAAADPSPAAPAADEEPRRVVTVRTDGGTAKALARSSSQTAEQMTMTAPPAPLEQRSGLERLDDVLVPVLQRGARSTAQVASAPLRTVARAEDAVAGGAVDWALKHRQALLLAVTVLAVIGSAIHLQRYPDIQQAAADRRAAASEQTVSEPGRASTGGDGLAGGSQVIGPAIGATPATYIASRHEELRALPADERRVAVISFEAYRTAEEVLAAVPEGAKIHAAQLRIPAATEQPFQTEVVANDLLGSVQRALAAPLAQYAEEEAALEELIPTVTDETFKAQYEADLEAVRAVRNLVNSGAGTVFALLIEAPAGALVDLIELEGVRLVDVAPGETDPTRSGFYGLLPEDRGEVTYGAAT